MRDVTLAALRGRLSITGPCETCGGSGVEWECHHETLPGEPVGCHDCHGAGTAHGYPLVSRDEAAGLCGEVDRLRAENAALRAVLEGLPEWVLDEIAGWRGIVLGLNAVAASTADALRAHLAEVRR